MKRLLAASMLLVALLSTGCQMAVDVTTTVLANREIDQEIVVTLQGVGGDSSAGEPLQSEGDAMDADGWTRDVKAEGDNLIMRAFKHLQAEDALFPPSQEGDDPPKPQFDLQVVEMPTEREYRLTVLVPAGESAAPPVPTVDPDLELDPDLASLGDDLSSALADAFKLSWTINLPGEVVDTNADVRTKTGGTWQFSLGQMQSGRELVLVSREPRP